MKTLVQYIILILLTGALVAGAIWANSRAADELCTDVKVEIVNADSTSFVTPIGILENLKSQGCQLVGRPMSQINSNKVEQLLHKMPYVESAECVKTHKGLVIVRVSQLVPIMRVFDGDKSYYVNVAGKQMAAIPEFFCDVPIVYGHFTKQYPPERLLPMLNYVKSDQTLNALVSMWEFRDSLNIIMVPTFIGHVVNMGDAHDYENKFRKLLLFYNKVIPEKGWDTYDTISVKWRNQVVGTLRNSRSHTLVVDTTSDVENEDAEWINGGGSLPTAVTPPQNNEKTQQQ